VLGTLAITVALGYQARGRSVDPIRATRVGVRWVPRYLWTNVHTSAIFWVPVGLLVVLRYGLEAVTQDGPGSRTLEGLWWLLIAVVAVYLHTRTLLAPFLAVHADLPGTLATLVAWRLSGRRFALCLAALVLGALPVGMPLALLALAIWSVSAAAHAALVTAAPDVAWAGIQLIRPVLIPALYLFYRDLWSPERTDIDKRGGLYVPDPARALLAVTRPLPRLGAWD
jgi:hypothetical protein